MALGLLIDRAVRAGVEMLTRSKHSDAPPDVLLRGTTRRPVTLAALLAQLPSHFRSDCRLLDRSSRKLFPLLLLNRD